MAQRHVFVVIAGSAVAAVFDSWDKAEAEAKYWREQGQAAVRIVDCIVR